MNTIRAFHGLAGSPLSQPQSKKPGRPRKYANDKDKWATYNKQRKEAAQAIPAADAEYDRLLAAIKGTHDYKGRLHSETSGGYNSVKIDTVVAASERDAQGGRPRIGRGGDRYERDPSHESASIPFCGETAAELREQEGTFSKRHPFSEKWRLTWQEKEWIIRDLTRELFEGEECSLTPDYDPETGGYVRAQGTLTCAICNQRVDLWREATNHLLARHGREVRRRIRENQPRCFGKRRTKPCPESMHKLLAERLKVRKEPDPLSCKKCGKVIYRPGTSRE